MLGADKPIVDIPTLRRDLYLVVSLLLADREIAKKVPKMTDWTQTFYDNEVRRLMLWVATAMRSLLDGLGHKKESLNKRRCGEYWSDFPGGTSEPLTFRQACNSVIHAKEILPYKLPRQDSKTKVERVYTNRITARSTHKGKNTRAHLDIIKFVQIANIVINSLQEDTDHANL